MSAADSPPEKKIRPSFKGREKESGNDVLTRENKAFAKGDTMDLQKGRSPKEDRPEGGGPTFP